MDNMNRLNLFSKLQPYLRYLDPFFYIFYRPVNYFLKGLFKPGSVQSVREVNHGQSSLKVFPENSDEGFIYET